MVITGASDASESDSMFFIINDACYLLFFLIALQLGVALGFVLPPLLVPPDGNVQKNMHNMFVGTAAITSALLILILAGM